MNYKFSFEEVALTFADVQSLMKYNIPSYMCMYLHKPSVYRDSEFEYYQGIVGRISIYLNTGGYANYTRPFDGSSHNDNYVCLLLDDGSIVNLQNDLLRYQKKNLTAVMRSLIIVWLNSIESGQRQMMRCGLYKNELIQNACLN